MQFGKDGKPRKQDRYAFWGHTTENKQLYSTKGWEVLRTKVLSADPLCPCCLVEGNLTPAQEVDHVQAHKGDWHVFHDPSNLWALCKHHHNLKTAAESNGLELPDKQSWLDYLTNR